jgi:rRNA-processing protein EBP2
MVNKGALKLALAADKNTDYKKLNLKKKEKLARKIKSKKGGDNPDVGKIVEGEWENVEGSGGSDIGGAETVASALNVTSNADTSSSEEEEDDEVAGKMEVISQPLNWLEQT